MRKQRGFSLIELLIVVAIILIIAAIAIPNLIRSRMAANEASAVSTMRSLNTAELTFNATYGSGYTDNLTRLGEPAAGSLPDSNRADIVDQVLAGMGPGGTPTTFNKSGYNFVYTPGGSNTTFGFIAAYEISADPQARGSSGQRSFYTNEPLVIRSNPTAVATASDPPL